MEIIVGKTSGFCNGVKRTITSALDALESGKKIYSLGEMVHNFQVMEELKEKGLEVIEDEKRIKDKEGVVLLRAHGVKKSTYEYFKNNKLEYLDLTCPNVLKIHDIILEYHNKGYYILLVGDKFHPENIGSASFAEDCISVIESIQELDSAIEEMKNKNMHQCLLLSQTTCSINTFLEIKIKLEEKLPKDILLEVKNTICRATEIRQMETVTLAKSVDAMIIIGGKASSNTKALYEIANTYCKKVVWIESVDELHFEDFQSIKKIGIMAGASTPQKNILDVAKALDTNLG